MAKPCDNCGRAAWPLQSKVHIDGTVYCARANCQKEYEDRTGEKYRTLMDAMHETRKARESE